MNCGAISRSGTDDEDTWSHDSWCDCLSANDRLSQVRLLVNLVSKLKLCFCPIGEEIKTLLLFISNKLFFLLICNRGYQILVECELCCSSFISGILAVILYILTQSHYHTLTRSPLRRSNSTKLYCRVELISGPSISSIHPFLHLRLLSRHPGLVTVVLESDWLLTSGLHQSPRLLSLSG